MNFKNKYKNKKVLIMGLGIIGKGLKNALFFYKQGAEVTITDLKSKRELKKSLDKLKKYPKIKLHLSGHLESDFVNNDFIVRNPAIPKDSKFLKIARQYQKKIIMDDSLFVSLSSAKIIGITGTRGKTTSSTLLYKILKKAGLDVYLSGNIRGSASLDLLKKTNSNSYVVLELSSWQLQGFAEEKISPQYSAITNIYEDHLNRYKNMRAYVNDKKNIYKFQKKNNFLFLNTDLNKKYLKEFSRETLSKVIYFSKKDVQNYQTSLIGEHNLENIALARAISLKLGVSETIVKKVVKSFKGVEFRLKIIKKKKGITFVNDSASTAPIATIKALNSFKQKVYLIVGGASKSLDLKKMAKVINERCQAIAILNGDESKKLKKLLKKDLVLGIYNDLNSALKILYQNAKKGDVILFSPGAASFGMFKNEFDRGEQFNFLVKQF